MAACLSRGGNPRWPLVARSARHQSVGMQLCSTPRSELRCLQPDNDSENRLIAHCTVYSGTTCRWQGWILQPTPTHSLHTYLARLRVSYEKYSRLGCCRLYAKNYPSPLYNTTSFQGLSKFYRMSVPDEPFGIDFKLLPNLGYKGIWINWDFF